WEQTGEAEHAPAEDELDVQIGPEDEDEWQPRNPPDRRTLPQAYYGGERDGGKGDREMPRPLGGERQNRRRRRDRDDRTESRQPESADYKTQERCGREAD